MRPEKGKTKMSILDHILAKERKGTLIVGLLLIGPPAIFLGLIYLVGLVSGKFHDAPLWAKGVVLLWASFLIYAGSAFMIKCWRKLHRIS